MTFPGLISKEVIHEDEDHVVYREIWDLKIPGCPYVPVRYDPFRIDAAATSLTREYFVHRKELEPKKDEK